MRTFWPNHEGDNHCPVCDSELYIWSEYIDSNGYNCMYKLKCCECGAEYLLHESIRSSMNVRMRELPSQLHEIRS